MADAPSRAPQPATVTPDTPTSVSADPDRDSRHLSLLTGPDVPGLLATALGAAGGELISSRARQVVHQPGRDITVAYWARVQWPDGQVRDETLVACCGNTAPDTLVLDDGVDRIALWRFPADPDLPGLPAACDPQAVGRLLDDLGLGGDRVHLRTRAYRPRRRAVIEATGRGGRLFIKVVRPSRVQALHERHRLLIGNGVPVPQSLGWTPEGILVLQALPGRTLRRTLRSRPAPIPTGRDILDLLDRLPADLATGPPRQSWTDKAPHYATVIGAALPTEAQRATEMAQALAAQTRPRPIVAVHGDFYENQLLVDRGHITGLLDIDTAGPGDRLDDLACLLGHLSVLAQIDGHRAPTITHAAARYLAAFDAVNPPADLRYRIAAVVVSLATGSHRVQEHGWAAATRRRLTLAEQWLGRAQTAS